MAPLRFDVSGRADAGETVLLSTGLGGFGAFWRPQLDALGERYRVVAYDHRGVGANAEALPDGYAISDMADDVLAVVENLGAGRVHFVGHALGGLVGVEAALKAPERFASLTLVNAWVRIDPHTARCFEARLALLRHAGVKAYVRAQGIFLYPAAWASERREALAREEAHAIEAFQGVDTLLKRVGALSAFDATDRLDGIEVPTLVVAARDDVLVPWTASRTLAERMPGARLWLTEGGHANTAVDPAGFNAELIRFLESVTADRSGPS